MVKQITGYVVLLGALIALALAAAPYVTAQLPALQVVSAACGYNAVNLVTGTETALATTPGISPFGPRTVSVQGSALITAATQTTAMTLRLRRGTGTAGALVVTPTAVSATAQATQAFTFAYDDTPGEVANQGYTLTAQATGATANSTVGICQLFVAAH